MNNDKISVPRELLEAIKARADVFDDGADGADAESARSVSAMVSTLLAQPNTCTKDGGQCGQCGYCEPCHSVEPVAYLTELAGAKGLFFPSKNIEPRDCDVPLYRHPPAQVPVVLPSEDGRRTSDDIDEAYQMGWNACLDEFKRFNPTL